MMLSTMLLSSFPGGDDASEDEEVKPPSFHIQPRKAKKLNSCPDP